MPLYTFDAPPAKPDVPAPEKPPAVVACTIAETDSGDWCRWCGYAKERRA